MWAFLTSPDNVVFVAALVLMLAIGIIEALGLGGGFADGDGLDGLEADTHGGGASILSWLNVGRLPLLMLIVVFLLCFGLTGLFGQRVVWGIAGTTAPWFLAAPVAFFVALPITRSFSRLVARIMPRDETTAVSRDSLVGRVAVIVTGESREKHAAQARVRDEHGLAHYIMVEPDNAGDVFTHGAAVLLVRRAGATYFAIHSVSASLRDAAV